ncbi:short-chain-enoyl-CoA hydratase-like [Planococcus citri]|uniref:short-chain-enoyl-CoA hydratase-like n=1 Tax=Planococcus citri TaxID=170843 RepID=UPI0031FA2FFF
MILRSISKQVRHFSVIATDTDHIIYRKYPPVVLIGINNPDNRNAINESIAVDLKNALSTFENDDEAKVGVIFGEGGNFCAGYDLKELANRLENPPKHFIENDITDRFISKPLIAAVNGFAVGVGFDLALMCDLRIMETSAAFGYYGRRFGMPINKFGMRRLSAMVGFSKTMDLILTGRAVKSEEAFKIGLANRVVECGTAIGQALSVAQDIAKFPEAALLEDRFSLYECNFPDTASKSIKNLDVCSSKHREELLQDIKKGAKIFADGAGRKGSLFSKFLWDKV